MRRRPLMQVPLMTNASPSADRPHAYRSSVWLGPFKLNMFEQFTMTSRADAERSSDMVLRQVAPWLRPFCHVKWQ